MKDPVILGVRHDVDYQGANAQPIPVDKRITGTVSFGVRVSVKIVHTIASDVLSGNPTLRYRLSCKQVFFEDVLHVLNPSSTIVFRAQLLQEVVQLFGTEDRR